MVAFRQLFLQTLQQLHLRDKSSKSTLYSCGTFFCRLPPSPVAYQQLFCHSSEPMAVTSVTLPLLKSHPTWGVQLKRKGSCDEMRQSMCSCIVVHPFAPFLPLPKTGKSSYGAVRNFRHSCAGHMSCRVSSIRSRE